ncbi:MAG TPA: hypothetical protein VMT45_06430 [Thermoanaerobaculaceae bacterium]|nr:hypothetical protein [Thermoanaerobaculaceae bacterium]
MSLSALSASAATPCGDTTVPGLNSIELKANAGQQATKEVPNALKGKPGCVPTVCWLTGDQLASKWSCKEARNPKTEVTVFSVGVLGAPVSQGRQAAPAAGSEALPGASKGSAADKSTGTTGATALTTVGENRPYTALKTSEPDETLINAGSESLLITYKPRGGAGQKDQAYLQVEWRTDRASESASQTDTYLVTGAVTPGEDERFRLSMYLGGTYLYSRQNFGQAFPELRLIVQTDYRDDRLRREYCRQVPQPSDCQKESDQKLLKKTQGFFTFRGEGDLGLTSTSALSSSSQTPTAKSFSGSKSFDGHFMLGVGWTYDLATKTPDTDLSRLLVLIYARIGVISLPDVPADLKPLMEPLPFDDSFGLRFQNEAGHYRGGYFELGVGQSNAFVYQKTKRLKADAYLPFNQPNDVRLAARLEIDRPWPFGALNNLAYIPNDSTTTATERRGAGDIKIGLLLNIDIGKVFDLMGAASKLQ